MRALIPVVMLVLGAAAVPAEQFTWLNVHVFPDDLIATPYGWSAIRIEDPQFVSHRVAADDFELTRVTHITQITFWSVEVGEPWIVGGDWYIYAGGGAAPGDLLAGQANLPLTHVPAGFSHPTFGTIFTNQMQPAGLVLLPGHYFLAFRTYQDFNPVGDKNNNVALSTVWAHGQRRAYWNFGVLADGTVTAPWQLLEVFNLVTDNEWAFQLEGRSGIGDLNCDGLLNAFDIDPFVLALTDPTGYAAAYPNCDRLLADCNGDGQVNAFDIDPFVALLTGA